MKDTSDWLQEQPGWRCPTCAQERAMDGYDPCLGQLPGVKYACCGHGLAPGYIYFENGVRVGMQVTDVRYDDTGQPTVHFPPLSDQEARIQRLIIDNDVLREALRAAKASPPLLPLKLRVT